MKDVEGRVSGVTFLDKVHNTHVKVEGKVVVNASGCFADQIRMMDNPLVKKRIIPSGGSHLILPASFSSRKWGILVPTTDDGRILFILPWMRKTLVGTTDK